MSSRWTGFFVWALVAASTAFWAIRIFAAPQPVPAGAQAPQVAAANGPMERLFGAVAVPTAQVAPVHPESERFQLVGVIAPPADDGPGGYAIISLDNQPARTWRVGATVDGNTALLSVTRRGAEFGPPGGPAAFTLQLPEPAAAETGTLQPAVSQPEPAQMQQQQQARPGPPVQPQIAQPALRGGFPNSAATTGRGGYRSPPGGVVVPAKPGVPPDQQDQNDSGAVQQ